MDRQLVLSNARISIQTTQNINSSLKTFGIEKLIGSLKKIEEEPSLSPQDALDKVISAIMGLSQGEGEAIVKYESLKRNLVLILVCLVENEGAKIPFHLIDFYNDLKHQITI